MILAVPGGTVPLPIVFDPAVFFEHERRLGLNPRVFLADGAIRISSCVPVIDTAELMALYLWALAGDSKYSHRRDYACECWDSRLAGVDVVFLG